MSIDQTTEVADRWNAAIVRHLARGMSRAKAVAKVAAEDPQLKAAYVAEFNRRPEPAAEQPDFSQAMADWTALLDSYAANLARRQRRKITS